MVYDERLAERLRVALMARTAISEKKMFGGVAFLHRNNMFCGIVKDDLMVRVGPEAEATALKRPHTRPMDFTGRPLKGYVYVAPPGFKTAAALSKWVDLGVQFAASLPAKPARSRPSKQPVPAPSKKKNKG